METNPTHAGGIVYRTKSDGISYLLVGPKSGAAEWVLPKGRIEAGEGPAEAALREVEEETGVTAQMVAPLETVPMQAKGKPARVKFFLMEFVRESGPGDGRAVTWADPAASMEMLTHETSRAVLQAAERKRKTS